MYKRQDFEEFLIFKEIRIKVPKKGPISREVFDTVIRYYKEFIRFGGFPEVVLKASIPDKQRALDEILTSYFQHEVIGFSDFRRNQIVRDLILLLMERVGSPLDILRISRQLGVSRQTVTNYLSFLEGSFLLHLIRPFSQSRDVEIRKRAKPYFCDTGLLNRFARIDEGRILENRVLLDLLKRGEVNYYRRRSGVEIDFILDRRFAYEVKINPDTVDQNRIRRLSAELGLDGFTIVSLRYKKLDFISYPFQL